MSSLRFAAKMLIKQQRLPSIVATFARAISTSAPKPNFGSHEMTITNESVRIEATQLLSEPSAVDGDGSSTKSDKGDDTMGNVPKPANKDEMPPMTIVDINSGYGRMDFEERMEHMDLVDRINDSNVPKSSAPPMMPMIRELPSVVNIDAFSDDMMYEDKPEEDMLSQSAPIITPAAEDAEPNTATADGGNGMVPFADEAVKGPDTPATTQPETSGDDTMKAASAEGELAAQSAATTSTATQLEDNICIAPVDIDAFPKEDEDKKQGTVDIDAFGDDERLQMPPIPKVRNNVFEFKGIKVIMPKRMLREETYRYRLDPTDKDKPDDIHICVFEK